MGGMDWTSGYYGTDGTNWISGGAGTSRTVWANWLDRMDRSDGS